MLYRLKAHDLKNTRASDALQPRARTTRNEETPPTWHKCPACAPQCTYYGVISEGFTPLCVGYSGHAWRKALFTDALAEKNTAGAHDFSLAPVTTTPLTMRGVRVLPADGFLHLRESLQALESVDVSFDMLSHKSLFECFTNGFAAGGSECRIIFVVASVGCVVNCCANINNVGQFHHPLRRVRTLETPTWNVVFSRCPHGVAGRTVSLPSALADACRLNELF